MDVRFLTLSTPDLFLVLRTAVRAAAKGQLPESIVVGPFDDRLLVKYGVWLRGPDLDVMKAVRVLEKQLRAMPKPIHFVWSPEPLAGNGGL